MGRGAKIGNSHIITKFTYVIGIKTKMWPKTIYVFECFAVYLKGFNNEVLQLAKLSV